MNCNLNTFGQAILSSSIDLSLRGPYKIAKNKQFTLAVTGAFVTARSAQFIQQVNISTVPGIRGLFKFESDLDQLVK